MLLALDCGVEVPELRFCLRCCSLNCSKATWDGSFRERKPSTEPFFFFFDDFEPFDEELLEDMEARLDDVREVVSKDGREMFEGAFGSGVAGGS